MMTDPQYFHFEGMVDGTLTARHTIALTTTGGGVVVLDKADVLRILPQLQHFAEFGRDPDE
jgi:hypothetical protein